MQIRTSPDTSPPGRAKCMQMRVNRKGTFETISRQCSCVRVANHTGNRSCFASCRRMQMSCTREKHAAGVFFFVFFKLAHSRASIIANLPPFPLICIRPPLRLAIRLGQARRARSGPVAFKLAVTSIRLHEPSCRQNPRKIVNMSVPRFERTHSDST